MIAGEPENFAFDDEDPDYDPDDEQFDCPAFWDGDRFHCPDAGTETCDWECPYSL